LSSNKQSVDVHAEVLTSIRKSEEFKELRIIQEVESAKDQSLFLQEIVDFPLEHLEMDSHLLEHLDS
jgi:hypothetical protein